MVCKTKTYVFSLLYSVPGFKGFKNNKEFTIVSLVLSFSLKNTLIVLESRKFGFES